jgi:hypothetical protein
MKTTVFTRSLNQVAHVYSVVTTLAELPSMRGRSSWNEEIQKQQTQSFKYEVILTVHRR